MRRGNVKAMVPRLNITPVTVTDGRDIQQISLCQQTWEWHGVGDANLDEPWMIERVLHLFPSEQPVHRAPPASPR